MSGSSEEEEGGRPGRMPGSPKKGSRPATTAILNEDLNLMRTFQKKVSAQARRAASPLARTHNTLTHSLTHCGLALAPV